VDYINVTSDASHLEEMLVWSKGRRSVPVLVEGNDVKIGFGGA